MNADRQELSERLGARLKEARGNIGLSLDALSSLAGVSKSMLSQIERGESSPTVATLWNLTQALNVDFAGLLDVEAQSRGPILELVRAEQTPVIMSKGSGCQIRILSAPESVGTLETYDLQFKLDGRLESEPHSAGCVESLTVFDGELIVTTDGVSETVQRGDTIRYLADKPHSIIANNTQSRAVLIVKGS